MTPATNACSGLTLTATRGAAAAAPGAHKQMQAASAAAAPPGEAFPVRERFAIAQSYTAAPGSVGAGAPVAARPVHHFTCEIFT